MTQPITNESKSCSQPADRETFIGEIGTKLDKIQTKITSMRDEGSRLAGDLKRKADDNLATLDGKYKELKTKMEALKNSADSNWQNDKEVIQKSIQELSMHFKGLFS